MLACSGSARGISASVRGSNGAPESAPDRPALITVDGVRTYATLAERIRRLGFAFRSLGVGHGDRIAWLGENHAAFLEAFFAAGRIGAVLAPVNHYLPGDERTAIVADADPVLVLEHAAVPETAFGASVLHRIAVGGPRTGALDYESLITEASASRPDTAWTSTTSCSSRTRPARPVARRA